MLGTERMSNMQDGVITARVACSGWSDDCQGGMLRTERMSNMRDGVITVKEACLGVEKN